jgi:hypothetical protein
VVNFLPRSRKLFHAWKTGRALNLAFSTGFGSLCKLEANVAQLVEQRFRKARVAGSSPVVGSIFIFFFLQFLRFQKFPEVPCDKKFTATGISQRRWP